MCSFQRETKPRLNFRRNYCRNHSAKPGVRVFYFFKLWYYYFQKLHHTNIQDVVFHSESNFFVWKVLCCVAMKRTPLGQLLDHASSRILQLILGKTIILLWNIVNVVCTRFFHKFLNYSFYAVFIVSLFLFCDCCEDNSSSWWILWILFNKYLSIAIWNIWNMAAELRCS